MVAYLGLGSNLGDRRATIAWAVESLGRLGQVEASSPPYETLPEGGASQPLYVNAAVRLSTAMSPRALLDACLGLERERGRLRPPGQHKAPRTLDIDVLLYGDQTVHEPGLTIPHPALLDRPFVRIPLADVAVPGLRHPITGEPLDRATADPTVRRL